MSRLHSAALTLFLMLVVSSTAMVAQSVVSPASRLDLLTGWHLQSACVLAGSSTGPAGMKNTAEPAPGGGTISSLSYSPSGWIATSVPSTVVAAQVAAGIIKDPFSGMNLRKLPGVDYPVGSQFANLAMRDDSPYKCGWWYRTQFRVPSTFAGHSVALHLDGVNYRADVWLNGRQIASQNDVAGTWRVFDLDLTSGLLPGKDNVLAIEVFPPTTEDLAITWVDWSPAPPDKNTGLFRNVYLTVSGPVELRFPYVANELNDGFTVAKLTPTVEARNATAEPVTAAILWQIDGKKVHQDVTLAANERKTVVFDPQQFPELTVKNPRLWWPAQLGTPALYEATVSASVGGRTSDSQSLHFGIRRVTSEMDNQHALFRINGQPILIRGGGWAPDMLLRPSPERMETEFRYVRDLGLNTIRLEGKLEAPEFYDLADRYGIFIMAGWCCCDMWERWNEWGPEQYTVAENAQRDQMRLLRSHPSMLVWLNGSDNPPIAKVEEMYLRIGKEERWPNPFLSSASATPTVLTGPSGVKMTGPYDYVPPMYWLSDTLNGGAWGFNTETSPGPAIPTPASMKKFLPPDKLWPQNEAWGLHEGGERFQTLDSYNTSLEHRYGAPKDYDDFVRKAYAMDYEGERAMFEAYARNKYNSTGVIQWMLNNAWPSLIWHLYDYYLVPAGGYYGSKKANEPIHVLYSYKDRSVAVVSENGKSLEGVTVTAKLYNLDATEKWSQSEKINVTPDAAAVAFAVPSPADLTTAYFLKLSASDAAGKPLSQNFYWLSTKPDEMAWDKTHDTVNTPQSAYADLTSLQDLPAVALRVQTRGDNACETPLSVRPAAGPVTSATNSRDCAGAIRQQVTLTNPGTSLAFMTHLRLARNDGEDVVPGWFDDNYVSLLPGESRTITVSYRKADLGKGPAHLEVSGWNVTPQTVALR